MLINERHKSQYSRQIAYPIKIIIRIDRQRKKIKSSETRPEIVTEIRKLKKLRPETSSWLANVFGSVFHNIALKSFKNIDSTFVINDSCKSCGNCIKICPCSNIVIEDNRPTFKHNCELCHACIQWCPNIAIQHPNFDRNLKQYHHPAIHIADIIADNMYSQIK